MSIDDWSWSEDEPATTAGETTPVARRTPSRRRSRSRRRRHLSPQKRRRRQRRRRIAIGTAIVLVVVGAFVALVGYRMYTLNRDLRQAQRAMVQTSRSVQQGRLADGRASLRVASRALSRANRVLDRSPELDLASSLPIAKQNLEALDESVGIAFIAVEGGERILQAAAPLEGADGRLEVSLSGGVLPIETMDKVAAETGNLVASMPLTNKKPSRFLIPPVADAQRAVRRETNRRVEQLDGVTRAMRLMLELSGANGPRRYMLAIANTAEMRGSGGMILSFAVIEGRGGRIVFTDNGSVDRIPLANAVPVVPGVPDGFAKRWEGFEPNRLWRSANLSADFTANAPTIEAMFSAATGLAVNGVIQVDPVGLQALMAATGPVTVPNVGTVTRDTIVPFTLNEAYTRFPNRDARQDVLGDVAAEVLREALSGTYTSLRPVGRAIRDAANERHVMMHSTSTRVQELVTSLNASGALPPADQTDTIALTLQNGGGNKLDYYLDTTLKLEGTRQVGRTWTMKATVTATNTAPPESRPRAVFGPLEVGDPAGRIAMVGSLYVPDGTELQASSGPASLDAEGFRAAVAFSLELMPGETKSISFDLVMPPRRPALRMVAVPAPRVRPTILEVNIDMGDGRKLQDRIPLRETRELLPAKR